MLSVETIHASNCKNSCRGFAYPFTRLVVFLSIFLFSFLVVEVNAQTATITVNDNNVCEDDATLPVITFTGNGGTAEYTFTYTINGGGSQTTAVSNNDDIQINVPTGTSGTFIYNLISVQDNDGTGGSVTLNQSVAITVHALPSTPNITLTGSIPLCYVNAVPVTLSTPMVGGVSYQWYVTGFTPPPIGSAIGGATNRNYTANSSGFYTVIKTDNNGCSSASAAFEVTQMPTPTVAIFGEHDEVHDSRCINYDPPTLQLVNVTGGAGPLTYQWQSSPNGTAWTDISGETDDDYNPPVLNTAGNYYYRAVISDACDSYNTDTGPKDPKRITIVADPTVTVTTQNGTTFCQGATNILLSDHLNFQINLGSATYSYQWQYSTNPGGPWTNISSPNIPTGTAGTFYYQVVISSAPCNSITSTIQSPAVITINSLPVINDHPDDDAVCPGDDVSFTVSATGAINYQWRRNGVNIGSNSPNPTLTINNADAGDAGDYDVVVTNNCGSVTSNEATLTVSPPLNAGTINTTGGTFCVNWSETINSLTPATGQGLTYIWQQSVGCTGTWTDAPGTNDNASYTRNNFPSPGTYCYRRSVTDGCGNTDFTSTVTITIVADLVSQNVNPNPNTAAVCAGANVSANFSGGGGGAPGLYVDVYEYSTNSGANWSPYTSGNNISTTGLNGNNVVQIRTRRVMSGQPAGCNFGNFNTYEWDVTAAPPTPNPQYVNQANPLIINPTMCVGQTLNFTNVPFVGGTTYSWSGPNGFGSGSNGPQIANIQLSASGTYTVIATQNGCASAPGDVDVVVAANPTASISAGGSTTFCAGGSVTLTSLAAASYQWLESGNPIAGQTGQSFNATTSGNYSVRVANGSGCTAISNVINVTASPLPTTPTISTGGDPTTFCDQDFTILYSSAATGNQWYLNGNPIADADLDNWAATQSGSYTVRVSNGTCTATSAPINITVLPLPNVNNITGPSNNVCVGGTLQLSNSGGSWSSSNTSVATINGSGLVTGITAGGAPIIYTVTGRNGCENTAIYPVNVITLPIPPNAIASNTTICLGQTTSLSSTGTANSFATQTFCNGADDGFLNGNPLGAQHMAETGITASGLPNNMGAITNISVQVNITHPTDSEVEIYLIRPGGTINNLGNGQPGNQNTQQTFAGQSITLSSDNGGTGNNYNNTIFSDAAGTAVTAGSAPFNNTSYRPEEAFSTLTGNPNGQWRLRVVDDVSSGDVGTLTNWCITFTYGSGITYSWTSSTGLFTSDQQNPGNVAPLVTTTYTVTTTATGTGCSLSSNVTVNVLQPPTITLGTNPTVCGGVTSANLPYTATTGNPDQYSITWTGGAPGQGFNNVNNVSLPASPIVLTIPGGAAPGTYNGTLTVRNSAGGCNGTGIAFAVTIAAAPTVTPGPTIFACQSATPGAITLSGASVGGSATTGAWSITTGGGSLSNTGQTGNPETVTYTPPNNFTGNITLTLTTNAPGSCPAASLTRTITVNTAVTVDAGGPNTACQSASPTAIQLTGASITGGTTNGTWTIITGGGSLNNPTNLAAASYTPATNFSGTVTLRLTSDDPAGPCGAVSDDRIITVNPAPTANAGTPNPIVVCQSATPGAIPLPGASIGGSATEGTWAITMGSGTLSDTDPTDDPASVTFTPAAGFSGTVLLTLTTDAPAGCPPATAIRTITVSSITPGAIDANPSPASVDITRCGTAGAGTTAPIPIGSTTGASGSGLVTTQSMSFP